MRLAVFLHLYNWKLYDEFVPALTFVRQRDPQADIYISYQYEVGFHSTIKAAWPEAIWVHCDRGADLGGQLKMALAARDRGVTYDYVLKLHSKTSTCWRRELLKPLCGTIEQVDYCLTKFEDDASLGLIMQREWTTGIHDNDLVSLIKTFYQEHGLPEPVMVPADAENDYERLATPSGERYLFASGTMFWIRWTTLCRMMTLCDFAQEYSKFGLKHTDTDLASRYIHVWERLSYMLVRDLGYKIIAVGMHYEPEVNIVDYVPDTTIDPYYCCSLCQNGAELPPEEFAAHLSTHPADRKRYPNLASQVYVWFGAYHSCTERERRIWAKMEL